MTTLSLTAAFVAAYYGLRAGGPRAIVQALRDPEVPRRYKVGLAICALPWPGFIDGLVGAYLLARLARTRTPSPQRRS